MGRLYQRHNGYACAATTGPLPVLDTLFMAMGLMCRKMHGCAVECMHAFTSLVCAAASATNSCTAHGLIPDRHSHGGEQSAIRCHT